jgi:O-antigen ligase
MDYRSGGVGMFGNEGEFALLIGFVLPFWVFAASTIGNRLFRIGLMSGGTMLLFSLLVMTGTRSAFFALAPAALFLLARVNMTRKLLLIVAGLLLVAGGLAVTPEKTLQRLTTLGIDDGDGRLGSASRDNSEAAESARERKELMMDALQTIARNPVFGVGAGNFMTYRYQVLGAGHHKHWLPAHNTYLQIAAENGIVGGLIYLMLIGSILLTTFKVLRRSIPGSPQYDLVSKMTLCIQVSLVFFAAMSAFQNCDSYPHVFVLAGLTAALDRVTRSAAQEASVATRVPQRAAVGGVRRGTVLRYPASSR